MPTCTHPNARRGFASRSTKRRVAPLPSAIPTRKADSIVTNACVELPTTSTSTRVQTTSSASVTNPERPTATSRPASQRRVPGAGAAGATSNGSVRAARSNAAIPTATFAVAATHSVGCTPIARMSTNPAKRVPATAPAVLRAYSALRSVPILPSRATTSRVIAGSVAPIKTVGGRMTSEAIASRTRSRLGDPGESLAAADRWRGSSAPSPNVPKTASTPTPISTNP